MGVGDAISTHPDATIFHSTAWARVLVDTYGHRPCYVQMSLNGSLLALVPMMEVQSALTRSRGICLPFSDYCAPLTFSSFGHELDAKVTADRAGATLELLRATKPFDRSR